VLDIGATFHMKFQRDFFEELNENVDGLVSFVDGSNLKPMGIGTTKLKLHRYPNILLHDVLYLSELVGNFCLLCKFNSKAILFTCLVEKLK